MRRAATAMAAAAVTGLVATLAPNSSAAPAPLTLGPIVRITTPGTTVCPAEGEPETTHTRLGIWVAYNDDHQCPLSPAATRLEEVQLVPAQGRPKFIPLPTSAHNIAGGDPDLAPASDGGVYVSTLWQNAQFVTPLSIRIMHIDANLHVHVLPTPSFHGANNSDDKEFIAVDSNPTSRYAGRLYVAWDDFDVNKTVIRSWDGHHWSKPVFLQTGIGAPDVAVGPDGTVAVAMESGGGGNAIVRISHDGGAHFGRKVLAIKGEEPGYVDASCPLRPTVGVRQRAMLGARLAFDVRGELHVVAATGTLVLVNSDARGPAVVWHAVIRGNHVVHVEPVSTATTDEQWAPALAALPHGGIAVSWLQTNGVGRATYDSWVAVERDGSTRFIAPQRLSPASSTFPAATEAVGNSNCYGIGDYIGMTTTPTGVATVWPTTTTDVPGVDSDVLVRTAVQR